MTPENSIALSEYMAIRIWELATPLKPCPWNDALQLWERADDHEKRLCRLQARVAIDAVLAVTPVIITSGQ